ncbi:larval cuticle protein F1-like [Vanessa cardui]|uniref:larval cuticle protein F1-like n=1 Tax=Vanessa cardui TaxID=171605 RepID=UPI001F148140|nr:larval cuticle protein F1-like [Vanessa cardui]
MRVLIVAAAVLACAAAAPSGALLAHGSPYAHGLLGHGAPLAVAHGAAYGLAHAAPLAVAHAPAVPTIPPGDIQGAAIDAHVDATDHARAAVDAAREYHDQASELQGQAINAAEDHAWQAVDAAQTAQAQVDGAAAGVAPNVARQLAGHGHVAAYAAAPALVGHAGYGHAAYAAPVLAGHGVAAPLLAGHGIAAVGGSHSVATSSLSQTHPAPVVHAPVAYAAHGAYGHGLAHAAYGHGLAHGW